MAFLCRYVEVTSKNFVSKYVWYIMFTITGWTNEVLVQAVIALLSARRSDKIDDIDVESLSSIKLFWPFDYTRFNKKQTFIHTW